MSHIHIRLQDWRAWAPGLVSQSDWQGWAAGDRSVAPDGQPDVSAIPPMLRRRLSPVGKMALSVAMPLLQASDLPLIFASRHGEQDRTIGLLHQLADGEPLSPAAFSMSVHNAIAGLLSITAGVKAPITALAAGDHLLGSALLEASAQLRAGQAPQLLVVLYDLPLPAVYQTPCSLAHPIALALLLGREQGAPLSAELVADRGEAGDDDLLGWLRWYLGDAPQLLQPGARAGWRWRRC